jgi:D-aminopeptidase
MRLRDLGIVPGRLAAGTLNAITDVAGVRVGHVTLIEGEAVRTGVTAILPHGGSPFREKVSAGVYTVNGFGKAAGFEQIRERGVIETPILLTNTLNVGAAVDVLVGYMLRDHPEIGVTTGTVNAVVGECNDGFLNDIRGRHVRQAHVWAALDGAAEGVVAEGNVGAGTGTACFQFKGGIGTASRVAGEFTVGALVQTNYGSRAEMMMLGVPLGAHLLSEYLPQPGAGSIVMVLATDAPLDARQLTRLAKRSAHALGRTGTISHDGSGDFTIAFSTARRWAHDPAEAVEMAAHFSERAVEMDALFLGAVEAIEEAIWNAVIAAETMTGRSGNTLRALPHGEIVRLFRQYGRLG